VSSPGRRLALLIGVEQYDAPTITNLPSASTDVRELSRVLKDPSIGRFDLVVDDVGPAADAESIRLRTAEFLRRCQPSDFVVLYISGHGERARHTDGQLHFLASDTDVARLADTSVPASFVNEQLEVCRARQKVAIFDCCMSGGYALGFKNHDAKSSSPRRRDGLLDTEGVYVVCSSRLSEASFTGKTEGEPSQFTGALIKGLKTGEADKNLDGVVDMDDLFAYVSDRMRSLDPDTRQTPVKSSLQVSGELVLAYTARRKRRSHPHARQAEPAKPTTATQLTQTGTGTRPSWPTLIEYYRQAVIAERAGARLLDARPGAGGYVCMPGRERLLSGSLDEGAGIPVPADAVELVHAARGAQKDLVYGYPVVVLHQADGERRPQFAPLLVRQVKIIESESGTRLEPYGTAQVNPVLARELLDVDAAAHVAAAYRPTWLAGGLREMARDLRFLLTDAFELAEVEQLHPEELSTTIDVATPTDGARNAAVLMRAPDDGMTARLIKDLGAIVGKHKDIPYTALGALLGSLPDKLHSSLIPPVTIGQANEAQLAVLAAALSSKITVATGPPGTGKSELIANLAATGVAAGRSVLIASTNNQAVDEVWRRCEAKVPGLIVRTGNQEYRPKERDSLAALLALASSTRPTGAATNPAAHAAAVRRAEEARSSCAAKALWEQRMLKQGRLRNEAGAGLRKLGAQPPALATTGAAELERLKSKAAKVANARLFGGRRRGRLLGHAGVCVEPARQAEACRLVAELAAAEQRWRELRAEVHSVDATLVAAVDRADADARRTSLALMSDRVATGARSGNRLIQELLTSLQSGPSRGKGRNEWHIYRELLAQVRGWAVSALSVMNFPSDAGLFDLVIIDEASQCSIAATLPLLFRAKSALIIGDPMQLRHIASLRPEQDSAIGETCGLDPAWLAERKLTYGRHSSFDAWEALVGGSLLLDEHYRCHPHIAAIADAMFYAPRGKQLVVLTDVARLRSVPGSTKPRIAWDARSGGRAEPGPGRKSWINRGEARLAVERAHWLLTTLPPDSSVGIVTPFRPQADLIAAMLGKEATRVRVGTVHTFQGGECDAMIFSLVATESMAPGGLRFFDRDENLWNVAITRAKALMLVIGDRAFWESHGALGGKLAARIDAVLEQAASWRHSDEVRDLFYDRLTGIGAEDLQLGISAVGYPLDARLSLNGAPEVGFILDMGTAEQADAGRVLRQQIRRAGLIASGDSGITVRRLPLWLLYASDEELAAAIR
jgi:AAA domain/Caspase domain